MDIREISRYIIAFILLILLQVIVLNNIVISKLGITPYMYILFILILPIDIHGWILLLVSFFLGLTLDVFVDTLGVHTSACVFLAFVRPAILSMLAPRDDYEANAVPRIANLGTAWYVKYALSLIIIHHFVYFMIEIFSFSDFHLTLTKIILTSLLSFVFIFLSQFFMFRK